MLEQLLILNIESDPQTTDQTIYQAFEIWKKRCNKQKFKTINIKYRRLHIFPDKGRQLFIIVRNFEEENFFSIVVGKRLV